MTGKKYDAHKAPVVQGCFHYFPDALLAVAMVSKHGAEKYQVPYSEKNFAKVEDGTNRYTDAGGRHLLGEAIDGWWDPDSNMLHAAHHAWDALARLQFILKKEGISLYGPPKEDPEFLTTTFHELPATAPVGLAPDYPGAPKPITRSYNPDADFRARLTAIEED